MERQAEIAARRAKIRKMEERRFNAGRGHLRRMRALVYVSGTLTIVLAAVCVIVALAAR